MLSDLIYCINIITGKGGKDAGTGEIGLSVGYLIFRVIECKKSIKINHAWKLFPGMVYFFV